MFGDLTTDIGCSGAFFGSVEINTGGWLIAGEGPVHTVRKSECVITYWGFTGINSDINGGDSISGQTTAFIYQKQCQLGLESFGTASPIPDVSGSPIVTYK